MGVLLCRCLAAAGLCYKHSKPLLNVLRTPEQAFCARQSTHRRKRFWVARRIAANAGDGLMQASGKLFYAE